MGGFLITTVIFHLPFPCPSTMIQEFSFEMNITSNGEESSKSFEAIEELLLGPRFIYFAKNMSYIKKSRMNTK